MVATIFEEFMLVYVPKDKNVKENLLSKLVSIKRPGNHRLVIQENLEFPSVTIDEIMEIEMGKGWTNMYVKWLLDRERLVDPQEVGILRKNAARYALIDGH